MTEKRFTETISTMTVKDNQTGREYKCEMGIDTDLLNLLNEQHEEIRNYEKSQKEALELIREQRKFIDELYKENEQLKQSNERLLKMLDNVANYMQKENKYMPIDDFVEWWNNIATEGLDGDFE